MTGQGAERCGLGFRLVQTFSGPSAAPHGQLIIKLYPCMSNTYKIHVKNLIGAGGPGGGSKNRSLGIYQKVCEIQTKIFAFFSRNVSFAANPSHSQYGHWN